MPTATANGLSLAYELRGDPAASPMLFIMGLGMPYAFWPDAFVDGLIAQRFRAILFDNRDAGHSAKMPDGRLPNVFLSIGRALLGLPVRAPYDLRDLARDTAGLLDAIGVERAHVVGVSLGGMIAQSFAAHFPERTTSLTSIMSSSGNPRVSLGRAKAVRVILRRPPDPADREAVIEYLVHELTVIGSPGFRDDPALLRRYCERVAMRGIHPPGTRRQLFAILASGDRRAELARVRAPTLVIHGTEDPLIRLVAGRDTAANIPGAKLMVIEGMGHDLPLAITPRMVEAIAEHCRASG